LYFFQDISPGFTTKESFCINVYYAYWVSCTVLVVPVTSRKNDYCIRLLQFVILAQNNILTILSEYVYFSHYSATPYSQNCKDFKNPRAAKALHCSQYVQLIIVYNSIFCHLIAGTLSKSNT